MAKILVVDDSQDTLSLVIQALGQENEIFTVGNWANTTEYIFKHDLDLILMDVNMPGLPGDTLAESLIKKVKNRPVNIVLFSAIDEAELRRRARKIGAKGYIPKTFDRDLLRTRVRRFLQ